MSIQRIVRRFNGSVLWEGEAATVKDAIHAAIAARANLSWANLSRADLSGADLSRANLSWADLSRANLSGANLSWANLSRANLWRANLWRAELSGAELSLANLSRANLSGADLSKVVQKDLIISQTRILPDGDLIGWKKCQDGVIVKLLIGKNVKRSHAFGRKCRAERAKVLDVIGAKIGLSQFRSDFKYEKGKTVKCHKWNDDFSTECGDGIHFFITRLEAENY